MKYANVIFDMDGVLIDNSEGIMHCARYAIAAIGLEVPPDGVLRKFIGPALVWSLKTYCGASDEQALRGLTLYRDKYVETGIKMFRLYDGVEETVRTLHSAGVRLSVASGKPTDSVREILSSAGIDGYFEAVAGTEFPAKVSSKDEQMKTAVLARPALMVGDRVFDIECAANAGADCAFARYGFGDESDYAGMQPKYFIDRPTDIIQLVI